jgi:XamI restriction endonuclease
MFEAHPEALPTLRMSTAPPLAVDRLIGLAGANKNLVGCMEEGKLPKRMESSEVESNLAALCRIIARLLDTDIFPWLENGHEPTELERTRAATIVADRLCSAVASHIVRKARKLHQLSEVAAYLETRGYCEHLHPLEQPYAKNEPGTYTFGIAVPVAMGTKAMTNVDVLIHRKRSHAGRLPLLLDVKSSENFAMAKKRAGEGGEKLHRLRMTYGRSVTFVQILSGYFDSGYLGKQAAEGVDWIWQHRLNDIEALRV